MSKITQLKEAITSIENSIEPSASKEDLYDLLIVAYNYYKDIVALQSSTIIETPVVDDSALIEANIQLVELKAELDKSNKKLTAITALINAD